MQALFHRPDILIALIVAIGCGGYATVIYKGWVWSKQSGEDITTGAFRAYLKAQKPWMLKYWVTSQVLAIIAGLYILFFR